MRRDNIIPITVPDWRRIGKSTEQRAWEQINRFFYLAGIDENGRPNEKRIDSLEPYRSFIFKKLGKLWRDYKYHLHQQVVACETVEEMEANMLKGVSET